MDWYVEDKTLILETGERMTFDFPIKNINESTAQIDIKLEVTGTLSNHNNSFYFSKKDNKITWMGIAQVPKLSICAKTECKRSRHLVRDWGKEGNKFLLGKNKRISFDYPIRAALNSCGIIVVVLDIPPKQSMTENVFGISEDGDIIWQIERISETASDTVNRYTGIGGSSVDGIAVAFNWNCTNVYINVETGKVISTEFTK
jgi:hypothetical protein